jgi:CRISPR-associated protein Cas2
VVIVSYDISDDKLRAKFSKYLCRFGHRIQYSVFEIDNSNKLLNNIICDIENCFSKKFTEDDSVYIFKLSSSCEVIRYGFAKHEEEDVLIIK